MTSSSNKQSPYPANIKRLDSSQLKFLLKMDEWLSNTYPPNHIVFLFSSAINSNSLNRYSVNVLRDMLSKIMTENEYTAEDSGVLNLLRSLYIAHHDLNYRID